MTTTTAFLIICLLVLPQWLLMIAQPNNKLTQRLVDSDIIPFILLIIFIVCMSKYEGQLQTDTISNLLLVFKMEGVALGAWAYVGFMSLLISGWAFNHRQALPENYNWVLQHSVIFMMLSPFLLV